MNQSTVSQFYTGLSNWITSTTTKVETTKKTVQTTRKPAIANWSCVRWCARSTRFERARTILSYSTIVTVFVSRTVSKIQRRIGRESRNFHTPHVVEAPLNLEW